MVRFLIPIKYVGAQHDVEVLCDRVERASPIIHHSTLLSYLNYLYVLINYFLVVLDGPFVNGVLVDDDGGFPLLGDEISIGTTPPPPLAVVAADVDLDGVSAPAPPVVVEVFFNCIGI